MNIYTPKFHNWLRWLILIGARHTFYMQRQLTLILFYTNHNVSIIKKLSVDFLYLIIYHKFLFSYTKSLQKTRYLSQVTQYMYVLFFLKLKCFCFTLGQNLLKFK